MDMKRDIQRHVLMHSEGVRLGREARKRPRKGLNVGLAAAALAVGVTVVWYCQAYATGGPTGEAQIVASPGINDQDAVLQAEHIAAQNEAQAFLEAQEAMNARQAEEWMAYTEEERLEGLVEPVEADPVEAAIRDGAEAAGIDPILIKAMIQKESQWNAGAMGDGGKSYGLMQIHKRFHTDRMARLGVTDLLDPVQNIKVGTDYLKELNAMSDGRGTNWLLMAYNMGPDQANKLWKKGTRSTDYTREISRIMEEMS